jgi:hypothetical protein
VPRERVQAAGRLVSLALRRKADAPRGKRRVCRVLGSRLCNESFEPRSYLAAQDGCQQRGVDSGQHRVRIAQAIDLIEANASLPIAKEQLAFPADSVQFRNIVRREDEAREVGKVRLSSPPYGRQTNRTSKLRPASSWIRTSRSSTDCLCNRPSTQAFLRRTGRPSSSTSRRWPLSP